MSIPSTLKLIEYISRVSKVPILLDGILAGPEKVERVKLNSSFFWKDGCDMCGRCCIPEENAWDMPRYNEVSNLMPEDFSKWDILYKYYLDLKASWETKIVNLNGKDVEFVVSPAIKDTVTVDFPDRGKLKRCRWLFEDNGHYRCGIHPARSITCGMPHCRFFHNKISKTTTIGVSQYGRNWALHCPVEFEQFVDEEGVKNRILWLHKLDDAARYYNIPTYLPEILEYLESGKRVPGVFEGRKKLF